MPSYPRFVGVPLAPRWSAEDALGGQDTPGYGLDAGKLATLFPNGTCEYSGQWCGVYISPLSR